MHIGEYSTAFLFRVNRRHRTDGQTDRRTTCNTMRPSKRVAWSGAI